MSFIISPAEYSFCESFFCLAGNGGGHRFHHHHGHHHQYPSVSGQGPSSNTHHVLQFHDHHERIRKFANQCALHWCLTDSMLFLEYPQSGEVVQQHSAHQSFQRQVTAGSIGSSNSTVTSAGQIPELQQGNDLKVMISLTLVSVFWLFFNVENGGGRGLNT